MAKTKVSNVADNRIFSARSTPDGIVWGYVEPNDITLHISQAIKALHDTIWLLIPCVVELNNVEYVVLLETPFTSDVDKIPDSLEKYLNILRIGNYREN